jgi:hypothetical protein
MKYINASTRTLVDFPPSGEPVPVYFLLNGSRFKIDRVVETMPARKTFDNCVIYKCECRGGMLELRWDRDKNRWYIDKIDTSIL